MDRESISNQLRIEHDLIQHIVEALRVTLDWRVEQAGAARKLSTLRFVTQAFQRHLERLMAIHEYDGYMAYVTRSQPHLAAAVDDLKKKHDEFRDQLNYVASHVDHLATEDHDAIEDLADQLRTMLNDYDNHTRKEQEFLQEALLRDEGGSG